MNNKLKELFEIHETLIEIEKQNLVKYDPNTNVIYFNDGTGIDELSFYVDLDEVNKINKKHINECLATYNWWTLLHNMHYQYYLKLLGINS